MKRLALPARTLLVGILVASFGCAQILGADFDGATLDAGTDGAIVDAAPQLDALPDAPALDPRALAHLELWLAADLGVTEPGVDGGIVDGGLLHGVGVWEDQSGKGHAAIAIDPQRRPLVVRDGTPAPVIAFDREQKTCLAATWARLGPPEGLTLFVVSQGNATDMVRFGSALAFPWDSNDAHAPNPDLRLLVATTPGAPETLRLGTQGRAWEVLSARLTPRVIGGLRTYRNGELIEQASLADTDLPSLDALNIGCAPAIDEFASARVAEILVYTSALADPDRQRIEQYLRTKWQIR